MRISVLNIAETVADLIELRELDTKFDNMIQNMPKYIDAENHYLYIKGQQDEQENYD